MSVSLALKLEEQVSSSTKVIEKQGIVTILGSDCERTRGGAASLRRTLSADMSSKKWLAQNGSRPMMKKIASSEELPISTADHHSSSSSSSLSEDEYEGKDELQRPGQDEIWRSIQSQKEKNEVEKPNGWSWVSILTQKNDESNEQKQQPPYIHPLVKRSTSSLSGKSLEICTESLGSETGSDGFSSCPPSEAGEVDEEKEDGQQQQEESPLEDSQFVKYNYNYPSNRKMLPRSFPPPLPSLAREDGASLHMQCHRQNGRLVLEAVSVPSTNYFHAQRQDGRLLLTLVNNPSSQDEEIEDEEEYTQVFDNIEEEIEENEAQFEDNGYGIEEEKDEDDFETDEEEEEPVMEERFEKENGKRSEMEFVLDQQHSKFPGGGGVLNVHKSALVMKRLMALNNKNLTWSPKFNKTVNLIEVEEEEEEDEELTTQLPQSLPPPQRVARLISATAPPATAASFNAYEYFWRQKPTVTSGIVKQIQTEQCTPLKNNNNNQQQENKNKAFLASNLKGYDHLQGQQNLVIMKRCNKPRRSLLLWEPHCIATSS